MQPGTAEASIPTAVLEEELPLVVRAPSLEIHERYITILDLESGQKVVTVIEVVSPSNIGKGAGTSLRSEPVPLFACA